MRPVMNYEFNRCVLEDRAGRAVFLFAVKEEDNEWNRIVGLSPNGSCIRAFFQMRYGVGPHKCTAHTVCLEFIFGIPFFFFGARTKTVTTM